MEVEERSLTAGVGVGKMGMNRLSERDGSGRKKCWGREGRPKKSLRFEKQLTWVQKVVGLMRMTMMMLTLGVIRQRRKEDRRAKTNIVVAAPVDATEKLQGSHHKVPVYICLDIEEREKKKKRREEYGIGLG